MTTLESEAKIRTKARFEEVFQAYSSLSNVKKKARKKKTVPEEQIVLESLKNQLDLTKESVNEAIINTYNAEKESPRFTKNRLRERIPASEKQSNVSKEHAHVRLEKKKKKKEKITETVISSEMFDEQSKVVQMFSSPEKQKFKINRKKEQNDWKEESHPIDFKDKDHLIDDHLLQVSHEETEELREKIKKKLKIRLSEEPTIEKNYTVPMNNDTGFTKKKKKDLVTPPEQETSVMSVSELQEGPDEMTSIQSQPHFSQDIVNEDQSLPRGKGKKSKKKSKADDGPRCMIENDHKENRLKHVYEASLVLGVCIHRSDKLLTDLMISCPVVKIHIFDQKTGQYVKKESSINSVSSYNEHERNEYILPLETFPYDFKKCKSSVPEWDEQIVFNERFSYFLHENDDSPEVIFFFEIIDMFNLESTDPNSDAYMKEKGCQKIAWAFLKLVGANEVLNIDTKLRLQLYYPPSRTRVVANNSIYQWWLKYPRNRYPSTLYVTVKGLKLKENVDTSGSFKAIQQELDSSIFDSSLQNETDWSLEGKEKKEFYNWTRLSGQACRIPNKCLFALRAGSMGCYSICFSNSGKILAAACGDRDGYPVYLYEIPSGRFIGKLTGHLNVVYDLCWSTNDHHLLTASSDATARLWKLKNETASALKVLPHPSFVYTAKFHPKVNSLVVTGCYDSLIRVWNVKVKEINGHLLQEFDGHNNFINTLCFDIEGNHMYSGDSSGLIIVWNTSIGEKSWQNTAQRWSILKEITDDSLKGIPINHLQVHPNGRRLLIHAKDSSLRIMDLRILAVKKLIGATNYRDKIHSAFTPCGTFVFAGSEDGIAYVWNAETGDQVAKYSDLSYTAPLRDVAFHPHEHMVAFCAFGQSHPILLYIYDYKVSQLEAEAVQTTTSLGTVNAETLGQQESIIPSANHFASAGRTSLRLLKVKQKLDSVLSGSNSLLPAPSLLSPHSKLRVPGAQLINQPLGTSTFGGFSPIGQTLSRTPSIKLQMSDKETKVSSLSIEACSLLPIQETVVALYDYTAHRSDELTIHRSDIIHVLYKDNDNWWFGSLTNGQQGYFPATYVAIETQYPETTLSTIVSNDTVDHYNERYKTEQTMNSHMWI
ncbi:hypothetical protein GDO86_009668 [Hymenochirus boettgeri]|uniref:Jouberin n=1 Tax=Hymenochirus boettgeri TaxID=247094 RepID=A0A8T2JLI7_9PIPI|nr:hypothetical protein GDO86_009668 [Hymenochirus boettgeri]